MSRWLFIIAAFLVFSAGILLGSGCAATAISGSNHGPSMGCEDPVDESCDDPTAYPPLTKILPQWPFPKLLQPLEN